MDIKCKPESIISSDKYRISILTERLIRLEYSPSGKFEDRMTQSVINRSFPNVDFEVKETEENILITTKYLKLTYNRQEFSPNGLYISINGFKLWKFGSEVNDLLGTARTLDEVDGETPLEHGVISREGFAVFDDSKSLVVDKTGWVEKREGETDIYFFGYGHDYYGAIKDLYKLCGTVPMLPRYALGNWWSRYHDYTQQEYCELMDKFTEKGVPLSVAVLDMDWHYVDIDSKYDVGGNNCTGWTGYTWNENLFPDYKKFLDWLHNEKKLHVTLNVHPADGIRGFEKQYKAMAEYMGVDAANEEHIPFDATSKKFFDGYFKYLHRPLEEEGVDFWWIDWQQGTTSKIDGLDPLWMLNHFHYLDNNRDGKRGMILSRYAGIGSHRYPIGFSGDTYSTWESLKFQPYFTANATNVGYGWWSHDIGGHMHGFRDEELMIRWIQFGVFSPIMRLHCSCNPLNSKEPWAFHKETERVINKYLRLRHRLIPYIYTMMHKATTEFMPLIRPIYYNYPEECSAYNVPNEYFFGTEMIVAPITEHTDKTSCFAETKAWLPEGIWFDFFNGRQYKGGKNFNIYRCAEDYPVFVKAGGIIPLSTDFENLENINDISNPTQPEIHVFAGADGKFTLYEDDDKVNPQAALTDFDLNWNKKSFSISKVKGNNNVIPKIRTYNIVFRGFSETPKRVKLNGIEKDIDVYEHPLGFSIKIEMSFNDSLEVLFPNSVTVKPNDYINEVFDFINQAQLQMDQKYFLFNSIKNSRDKISAVNEIHTYHLERAVSGALMEIIFADS